MTEPGGSGHPPGEHDVLYERRDIKFRVGVLSVVGLILLVIATGLLMFGVYILLANHYGGTPPRVEVRPEFDRGTELQVLREQEERILTGYHRLPDQPGIVRIPIRRAMQLVAEEGFSRDSRDEVPPTEPPDADLPSFDPLPEEPRTPEPFVPE